MALRGICSIALLLLFVASAAAARAAPADTVGSLTADADGSVQVAPDLVVVSLGVVSQAQSASAALANNNADMAKVLAALKTAGVADADVATSNFTIQPVYADAMHSQPTRIAAYEVSNSLTVKIHDVQHSGALLDQVLAAGADRVDDIEFTLADPSAANDHALTAAVTAARHKGELMATAAGVKLGRILSVTSNSQTFSPRIMAARVATAVAVPLAAGQRAVTAHAAIVWEIAQP